MKIKTTAIMMISVFMILFTSLSYGSEGYQLTNQDNQLINTLMSKLETKEITFLNKAYERMDAFRRSNQKRISININDRSGRIFMNILSKLQDLITQKSKESLENKINGREFTCVTLESVDSYDSINTDNGIDQYCQNHYRPNFQFAGYNYVIQEGVDGYMSVSKGGISGGNGPWFVIENNKVGYIKDRKLVLDTIYNSLGTINKIEDGYLKKTGYLRVCQDKCGIVDSKGNQVTPMGYLSISANLTLLGKCGEQYTNTLGFRIKYDENTFYLHSMDGKQLCKDGY